MQINVRVLFFGAAREISGADEIGFSLPEKVNAQQAFQQILQRFPALNEKFGRSLLFAVNQNYASGDETVQNGDELAIFPPVSGGNNEVTDFFELTHEPINVGEVARRVAPNNCGAIVTLDGFVREWTRGKQSLYLTYEAYEPMAQSEMLKLGALAREKFEIAHVGIVHRLGRLEIGETSVVISVGAPHRRAAFEACEWLIKELKRTVPIWKKEFYADGSAWTEGENSKA
jgi:molybdopterin synthase catalytic subunit